jgi:hypothetical protein
MLIINGLVGAPVHRDDSLTFEEFSDWYCGRPPRYYDNDDNDDNDAPIIDDQSEIDSDNNNDNDDEERNNYGDNDDSYEDEDEDEENDDISEIEDESDAGIISTARVAPGPGPASPSIRPSSLYQTSSSTTRPLNTSYVGAGSSSDTGYSGYATSVRSSTSRHQPTSTHQQQVSSHRSVAPSSMRRPAYIDSHGRIGYPQSAAELARYSSRAQIAIAARPTASSASPPPPTSTTGNHARILRPSSSWRIPSYQRDAADASTLTTLSSRPMTVSSSSSSTGSRRHRHAQHGGDHSDDGIMSGDVSDNEAETSQDDGARPYNHYNNSSRPLTTYAPFAPTIPPTSTTVPIAPSSSITARRVASNERKVVPEEAVHYPWRPRSSGGSRNDSAASNNRTTTNDSNMRGSAASAGAPSLSSSNSGGRIGTGGGVINNSNNSGHHFSTTASGVTRSSLPRYAGQRSTSEEAMGIRPATRRRRGNVSSVQRFLNCYFLTIFCLCCL